MSKRQSSDCKREGNPDKGEEKGGQQFLNDPVEIWFAPHEFPSLEFGHEGSEREALNSKYITPNF